MRGLLCLVAFVAISAAQVVPPTVIVTDENGAAVRSARVLIETPARAPLQCLTDFNGHCQFPSLGAGSYKVRVEKEGFYATEESGVQIAAGSTIEISISRQQEVKEVVNVRESPPQIDASQIASQETITGLDVINIVYPDTNDYRNALNFIPGVIQDQSGQPHVAGAETYQTVTLLDGFNVTQPANGQLLVRVSTDAFRSIQVEPSREPAEDGKGSGGVVNLNTNNGDDRFRFFGTDFIPSIQDKHGIRFDQFLPRLTYSGPIVKKKIWFYNAFDGEYDNVIYTELPVGQDNDHIFRVGNLFKILSNVTNRDIVSTSFLVNYLNDQYYGLSPLSPQTANPKDVESAYVASVKEQHYFPGKELLEAGVAFDQYNVRETPYGTSAYFVNSDNEAGGNYYLSAETHADRWQGIANEYLPTRRWHGTHDFKFGVDLDRISYDAQFARLPISFLSTPTQLISADQCLMPPAPNAGFPCTRYSTFGPAPLHHEYNTEVGGYLEDRWGVTNRLLIEPGVRLDWDDIVRHAEIAPRLAGTYVLDNSASTKLSAGIGIIYDSTPIFLIARPYAGTRQDCFFGIGTIIAANCNRDVPATYVNTSFSVNSSTLEMPRFVNWSVGLEQKLPHALYMKAEFLQKRGTRGFAYNTSDTITDGVMDFSLQNTRDDHYDALQFTMRHNFKENYTIMGSYVRSSTHSNEVLDFNVDNPILTAQQPGPYPWDAPNRFLSWGYLPFFKLPLLRQTELAYSMEARSGFPYSLFNDQAQLISPVGEYRFPAYFTLNLQLEKRFHFLGYYLALRGGLDNVTGRCDPFVVNDVIDANHPTATFSACLGRAFTSRIRLLERK
jgi:Carboxypeptidase regulatory-like domain